MRGKWFIRFFASGLRKICVLGGGGGGGVGERERERKEGRRRTRNNNTQNCDTEPIGNRSLST